MESHIVKLIKNDKNWLNTIEKLGIKVKINGNLAIFNYGLSTTDIASPIAREARGIIINIKNPRVVCWPFSRFFNSHEEYADTIDWNNCRVEDKIDGSIIKLWWNAENLCWTWSTNSCIDAYTTPTSDGGNKTYGDLIKSAINYKDIDFDSLNKFYTYIFELISPDTQVVIHYSVTKLIHIGTRNNLSGEEMLTDIGIEHPMTYDIHSLKDCITAANNLNRNNSEVKKEGFVVVDSQWHRVKIKSPEYLELHHNIANWRFPKDVILKIIIDGNYNDKLLDMIPFGVYLRYYSFKYKELEYNISRFIDYTRGLYEEYRHDRKAIANAIKWNKYAAFGFAAIGNDRTAYELLKDTKMSTLCKLIPDYRKEEIFK